MSETKLDVFATNEGLWPEARIMKYHYTNRELLLGEKWARDKVKVYSFHIKPADLNMEGSVLVACETAQRYRWQSVTVNDKLDVLGIPPPPPVKA